MNATEALQRAIAECGPRNQHDYGSPDVQKALVKLLNAIGTVTVPKGFVLVPEKLTPEMRFAYSEANKNAFSWPDPQWAAMLAARPEVK